MGYQLVRSFRFVVPVACGLVLAFTVLTWKLIHSQASDDSRNPPTAVDGPRLELDDAHRDLGIITPTEKVSLEYRLRNTGGTDLIISNLKSSCGCAPATIDMNPVPPGKTTTIAVSFQAPAAAGLVAHAVLFETNDPDRAAVQLGFQVMVQRPVEASPPNLYVGAVMSGQTVSHELELCTTAGDAFEVKELQPSASWIRAEPIAGIAVHRRRFRIMIEGKPKPGKFSESVQFRTTCTNQEVVLVPVTGEVVAGFKISPSRLLLASAPAGSVVNAQLLVTEIATGKAAVDSVHVAGDDWQVTSWKTEKKSEMVTLISLKIRVPETAGYKRTTLHLRAGARSEPYDIPVSCLVREKTAAEDQKKLSQ